MLPPVTRSRSTLVVNGERWSAVGPNVYWLGLDDGVPPTGAEFGDPLTKASYPAKERVTEIMATVKALGGTMIRSHTLGISVGTPLSVMPELGVMNDAAFEPIDWAVYQAGLNGIRLMIPLVDNFSSYYGGKRTFLRFAGYNVKDSSDPRIQLFYTNDYAVRIFKCYIRKLLTHRNAYNGLTYAEDPTIFACETGNQLEGPIPGDMDCPASWTQDIARFIKELAPRKLVVDGTYGVNETHLGIKEIDIFSNHYYPVNAATLELDIMAVERIGRAYFVGEYDWSGKSGRKGWRTKKSCDLSYFFYILEHNRAACGGAFWNLSGRNLPESDDFIEHDRFTMHYGNSNNSSDIDNRIKLIRKHFAAMSSKGHLTLTTELPAVDYQVPILQQFT